MADLTDMALFGRGRRRRERREFEQFQRRSLFLDELQIAAEKRAEAARRQAVEDARATRIEDLSSLFGSAGLDPISANIIGRGGLLGGTFEAAAGQQFADIQSRRATDESFAETRSDLDRQRQFDIDTQNLTRENQQLTRDINRLSLEEAQRNRGQMPERMSIPVIQRGSNTAVPTLVDTPSNSGFHVRKNNMKQVLRGARDLEDLSDSLDLPSGVEFTGPIAGRQRALWGTSILAFAKSKEMGALQAPDERIARTVIPNPTSIGSNISATLRGTLGQVDAGLGFAFGDEGGFFGLSSADQISGMQRQYEVATREMYASVVAEIVSNPLLLDEFTDAELKQIPPEILAPISQYLQAARRDPHAPVN